MLQLPTEMALLCTQSFNPKILGAESVLGPTGHRKARYPSPQTHTSSTRSSSPGPRSQGDGSHSSRSSRHSGSGNDYLDHRQDSDREQISRCRHFPPRDSWGKDAPAQPSRSTQSHASNSPWRTSLFGTAPKPDWNPPATQVETTPQSASSSADMELDSVAPKSKQSSDLKKRFVVMRKQKQQKRAQKAASTPDACNLPEPSSRRESNSRNLVQNPPKNATRTWHLIQLA